MIIKSTSVILLCFVAFACVQGKIWRLPGDIKPSRYFLTMEPQLEDDSNMRWERTTFNGSVTIEIEALNDTDEITLHTKNTEIYSNQIQVLTNEGKDLKLLALLKNGTQQSYTIFLASKLVKNSKYVLKIGHFSGYLGNGEGFFLAKYMANDTVARRIAVTHFEPTGARSAFPCFDEPALKAKFVISLIRKENYNSISNQELETTQDLGNGRFMDTFKETPPMSTFTVAFAVTDFKSTEKVNGQRVIGRPSSIDDGDGNYALEYGIKTLKILEEFTGIDFPIGKMEQFAVPDGYFFNHAMENYGLVIYGETHLLRNNSTSSEADWKRTTIYIAHEFAHQWFGNLVSPEWWDYLWLSESFAAYFQYYIASFTQPTWRLMDQFIHDVVQKALYADEYSNAAPLNFKIKYIGQYPPFNIMYEKGSSLVRMMSHFLTNDIFQKGLQIYLHNKMFQSAVPSDLYEAFQKAIDEANARHLLGNNSVQSILSTWDTYGGFPIVTATRNYETGSVTLEQKNTFDKGKDGLKLWKIPVSYAFSSDPQMNFQTTTADFWLTDQVATLNESFPTGGWLIINKQRTGYYRVNYDLENWERIIEFMNTDNFTAIDPLTRAQLIDDSFNLANNKIIPYDVPLRLCDYIKREIDYLPLVTFYASVSNYLFVYNYGSGNGDKREFDYFTNYTMVNTISTNATEYEVLQDYMSRNLEGVNEYFKSKPQESDDHIDKLGRTAFKRVSHYVKKH